MLRGAFAMAERSAAPDDLQNRIEFYMLTHFPAMWHALQRSLDLAATIRLRDE
jgi:hypothetical protein